jgi:hypothetical protein
VLQQSKNGKDSLDKTQRLVKDGLSRHKQRKYDYTNQVKYNMELTNISARYFNAKTIVWVFLAL